MAMDYHSKISFWEHPGIWLKSKWEFGFTQKGLYFWSLLPTIGVSLGIIAGVQNIWKVTGNAITLLLAIFLFVYGLLNFVLVFAVQKAWIRLERERRNYEVMHKEVIELFREYRAAKRHKEIEGGKLDGDEIKGKIKNLLKAFNDNYMKRMYRQDVSAVIKYAKDEMLHPIREGEDLAERSHNSEKLEESFVYRALSEPRKKLRYIYVKDIDDPDKYEREVMGKHGENIKIRAGKYYKTFIALPIRAGKLPHIKGDFETRPDLGMLGFDLKEKYGFGSFESNELNYIACFADSLSEPLQDLVECDKIKQEEGGTDEPSVTRRSL